MSSANTVEASTTTEHLQIPNVIVEPDWLAAHLEQPGLSILDVRLQESYAEGHIPGAVWVDLNQLTTTVNGVPGMLLPSDEFAARMSQLGVSQNTAVVLYDDNWGMPASRVLWSLARYGHHNAAVLNGGWDRWQEEGRPWTIEPGNPAPGRFLVQFDDSQIAERHELLSRLDDPNTVLIDTRTPVEHAAGHLPGAILWDWMNGVPIEGWDTLRPAVELRAELDELGITPDKEVVTYCRSGARAAHTYVLLRKLGYSRVKVYDGSWLEWSQAQKAGGER